MSSATDYFGGIPQVKAMLFTGVVIVVILALVYAVGLAYVALSAQVCNYTRNLHLRDGVVDGFSPEQVRELVKGKGVSVKQAREIVKMGGMTEGLTPWQVQDIVGARHAIVEGATEQAPEFYKKTTSQCTLSEGFKYGRRDAGDSEGYGGASSDPKRRGDGPALRSAPTPRHMLGGDSYASEMQFGTRREGATVSRQLPSGTGSVVPSVYDGVRQITGRELQASLYTV